MVGPPKAELSSSILPKAFKSLETELAYLGCDVGYMRSYPGESVGGYP
jgi:hypothetical protein